MSKSSDRANLLAELMRLGTLEELSAFVSGKSAATMRRDLGTLFLSRCEYHNAQEWAEAVRLCEALTFVGRAGTPPSRNFIAVTSSSIRSFTNGSETNESISFHRTCCWRLTMRPVACVSAESGTT